MITETLEYLGAQLQRENAIPLLASALAASVAVVQLMWWQQHRKVGIFVIDSRPRGSITDRHAGPV